MDWESPLQCVWYLLEADSRSLMMSVTSLSKTIFLSFLPRHGVGDWKMRPLWGMVYLGQPYSILISSKSPVNRRNLQHNWAYLNWSTGVYFPTTDNLYHTSTRSLHKPIKRLLSAFLWMVVYRYLCMNNLDCNSSSTILIRVNGTGVVFYLRKSEHGLWYMKNKMSMTSNIYWIHGCLKYT